jgi:hypothetical protein
VANPATNIGIGIRRNFVTLGDRNFEPDGTVQYKSNKDGLEFMSVGNTLSLYNTGTTLPFDGGASPHTTYSTTAIHYLRLYWNQGWVNPLT